MPMIKQVQLRDRLLGVLPAEDFERIPVKLEFVDLPRQFSLSRPHVMSEFSVLGLMPMLESAVAD